MVGEEEPKLEPIKLFMNVGTVTIYPPEGKDRNQTGLWNADTVRVVLEVGVTPPLSEKEVNEVLRKSDRDMHLIMLRFLRLSRRKLRVPMSLPPSLQFRANYQWEGWQPSGWIPLATAMLGTITVVPQGAGLAGERWQKLQEEMRSGVDTELWEDFIEDSKVALKEDDLKRATLYAAIACEIFIKGYTEKVSKERGISPVFWKYLKDPKTETRVLSYYNEILHLVTGHSLKDENTEMYKKLKLIFNARNKIVHEGRLPSNWNPTQINQLTESIKASESIISWVIGLDVKNHLKS